MSGEKTIAQQIAEIDAADERKRDESRKAVRAAIKSSIELENRITTDWGLTGSATLFGQNIQAGITSAPSITTGPAKKKN